MINKNLRPEYLHVLEELVPAKPIVLNAESFATITNTAGSAGGFLLQANKSYKVKTYEKNSAGAVSYGDWMPNSITWIEYLDSNYREENDL